MIGRVGERQRIYARGEVLRRAEVGTARIRLLDIERVDLAACRGGLEVFRALHRGLPGAGVPVGSEDAVYLASGVRVGGLTVDDAWWANDVTLRMRVSSATNDASFDVIQSDRDGNFRFAAMAVPCPVADIGFVDVDCGSSLLPLLVLVRDEGVAVAAVVIPFPSLLRGGLHGAEGEAPGTDRAALARRHLANGALRLGQIAVDLNAANGSEPLFRDSVALWLKQVFDVRIVPGNPAAPVPEWFGYAPTQRAGRPTLTLGADILPTIAVFSSPFEAASACTGPVLISDPLHGRLIAQRSVLPDAVWLAPLQPRGRVFPIVQGVVSGGPLAIVPSMDLRGDVRLLTPTAVDSASSTLETPLIDLAQAGGATVLVCRSDRADATRTITSILAQDGANAIDILLDGNCDNACRALLAHRRPSQRKRTFHVEIDSALALPDPRTLPTLATLASDPHVAWAGCQVVRKVGTGTYERIGRGHFGMDLEAMAGATVSVTAGHAGIVITKRGSTGEVGLVTNAVNALLIEGAD